MERRFLLAPQYVPPILKLVVGEPKPFVGHVPDKVHFPAGLLPSRLHAGDFAPFALPQEGSRLFRIGGSRVGLYLGLALRRLFSHTDATKSIQLAYRFSLLAVACGGQPHLRSPGSATRSKEDALTAPIRAEQPT